MAAKKTAAKKAAPKNNTNQTQETRASVDGFLAKIDDAKKRADAVALCALMSRVTGLEPKMWGPAIIGFGTYHYKYASGREGDAPLSGFSPRKAALVLYLAAGFPEQPALMARLGKFKMVGGCLYVKTLDDVDGKTLETLVRKATNWARKQHKS